MKDSLNNLKLILHYMFLLHTYSLLHYTHLFNSIMRLYYYSYLIMHYSISPLNMLYSFPLTLHYNIHKNNLRNLMYFHNLQYELPYTFLLDMISELYYSLFLYIFPLTHLYNIGFLSLLRHYLYTQKDIKHN